MSEQLNISITGTFHDELTAATNKAKTALEELKKTTDELIETTDQSGTAGGKAASGFTKFKTALQTAGTKAKAFAQALPGIINGLSNVATSAINLHRSYRDLEDAQIRVDRTARALSLANEAVTKAQAKVNQLVAEGKKGTPEYAQALLDLEQAQANVGVKTDMHREALEAQSDAYQDFYISIIPGVLGVLATLGSTIQGVQLSMATSAKATTAMSTAMKALRVVMIAVPIVALATALLAVKTNAFGFRDALNELGAKIGTLIPQVKPLLQWIKDFAEALGLTEKAMDLSKAWDLLVSGFQGALNKLKTTDWKAVINTIVSGIGNFIKNFDWAAAWQSFKDALASFSAWLGPVMMNMGKFIASVIKSEGPKWWAGFQEALASTATWVGKGITAIGAGIAKTIVSQSLKWWKGFQDALASTATWVGKGITAIGTGITSTITKQGPTWWKGFQDALGASVTWVATQMKKVGDAIVAYFTKNATKIGTDIWNAIGGAIGAAAGGAWDFLTGGGIKGAEAAGGKGVSLAQANQMMGGGAAAQKVDYDITPAISKLDQLKAYVNTTTTQISAMFLTMGQSIKLTLSQIPPAAQMATSQISAAFVTMEASIKGTVLRISTTFTTMFTPLPGLAMTATSQVSVAFITMMTSITGTLTQIAALFPTTFATLPTAAMTATSQTSAAFVTMLSSITGTINQIKAQIIALQTAFTGLATSTAASMTSMIQTVTSMIKANTTSMGAFMNVIKALQQAFSTLSTSVSTYMSSMTSKVNSFGSAAQSAFKKVEASAKTATAGVKQLQSAINALKDKTITITVKYKTVGGLEHGGAFVKRAQHGMTSIVDRPTTFGGTRMGEGFKPELVTVTPLTRGTGNHSGPTLGGGAGGGGSQPIINNITVVLDGRVIQRFVEKTALNNIGLQI